MAYNTKEILRDKDGQPISQYYNPETDQYEPLEGREGANKVVMVNEDGSENQALNLEPILNKLNQLTGTVIDEESRKSNEVQRIADEDIRESNEIDRIDNELARESNEGVRESQELGRVSAESDRVSAETSRESAESTRVSQENTRQFQESSRESNEGVRESQESIRESNENLRIALYDDLLSKVATGFFKGEKGDTGNGLEYTWNGTQLGVRVEGTTEYVYVDLKGEKGDTGEIENLTGGMVTDALGYIPLSEDSLPSNLETTTGSQAKANQAEQNAKNYTDSELASFEGMSIHGNEYHSVPYAKESDLVTHLADDVSQKETHGLRVENNKLEYFTGTEWKIASGGIPVGNVSGLSAEEDNAEITLMWTDPDDRYLDDLKIAEWQGTKIVRKEGSYPVSDDDGVLVVDNTTKNQYSTNGYKDTGLTNEVTYYYMAFPYTEDAITVDGANRVAGTPTDADDPSGSPGAKNLISGTMEEGFFGEVPASELFTASEIASACGISQGTAQFENEPWLKFAIDGKIIFRPRKAIRHSISWNSINTANCVYGGSGGKRVTKNGQTYIVRLMKGALTDPSKYDEPDRGAKGSEWNRLMLPIHEQTLDDSWAYPEYVEDNVPIWNHNFGTGANGMYKDADLMTHYDHGNGSYNLCQETRNTDAVRRVYRGYNGVSFSDSNTASNTYSGHGWSPVLELIS